MFGTVQFTINDQVYPVEYFSEDDLAKIIEDYNEFVREVKKLSDDKLKYFISIYPNHSFEMGCDPITTMEVE